MSEALRQEALQPINLDFAFKSIKKASDDADSPLIIKGYANTVVEDRAGDVIPSSAWDHPTAFTNYKKNPIILFNHDYNAPIGKMLSYNVDLTGIYIEVEISKGANENIYKLIEDGVLRTFSIGFRIHDAEYHDTSNIFIITELELLEISVVSVPCNQDSVFEVSKSLNNKSFTKLKEFSTKKESPDAPLVGLGLETKLILSKLFNTVNKWS